MVKSAAVKFKPRSSGEPEIEMGSKIRLRRVEQHISQSELGEKLGVSFRQVQNMRRASTGLALHAFSRSRRRSMCP